MSRLFCCLLLSCLLAGGATAQVNAALRINGAWRGEVRVDPRLPVLPWRLKVTAVMGGAADLTGVAETPAGELKVRVRQSSDGAVEWDVERQTFTAGALSDWLQPLLALPAGLTPTGEVMLSGSGQWDAETGAAGTFTLSWPMDALPWTEHDLHLTQPAAKISVEVVSSAIAAVELECDWAALRVTTLELGPGRLQASWDGQGPWRIETATIAAWRGRVSLAPFAFDPAAPALDTTIALENVALTDLAAFFPAAVRAADGRLSGDFGLRWDPTDGLRPGRGALQILASEVARVRLAASPGLLSGRVPAKIAVLPDWLGPLAKWTAVENPAHDELEHIELGDRFIRVDRLEVTLHPDGLNGAVSARVRLIGRPEASELVEKIDFTVNVTGPLQELIELGLDKRSRVTTGKN